MNVIETAGVGRRYGARWALRDCTLRIPEGQLVAVVGPNGAGKSTLLGMVVGLVAPSAGDITVLGHAHPGSLTALDGIAFVAQGMPLPSGLTVADAVHLTRNLNHTFDTAYARRRLTDLGIRDRHRVSKLSGGQQAQLALTLALARHPSLLVLDEPTAPLDPLARHEFMAAVMAAMADGLSVVLSSHVLAELERVADHLVLISEGRVRLDGPVEDLLAAHRLVSLPGGRRPDQAWDVVESSTAGAHAHHLIRLAGEHDVPPGVDARTVGLEELSMAYLRGTGSFGARAVSGLAS